MISLDIRDEFSPLKSVILGTAKSMGGVPDINDAYDPKSLEHIKAGTYPAEEDMVQEMDAVYAVFAKYGVQVFRPSIITDCNQIFSRDIAFVIEDKFIKANILPDRESEYEAIKAVTSQLPSSNIIIPPQEVHVEGGDVMPHGDFIFVGTYTASDYSNYITARTNAEAIHFLKDLFPHKIIKPFELRKSNTNPRENALHLDCCFQPIGKGKAIIHKNGFLVEEEYRWLVDLFGKENIFEITAEEMYQMFSNVFSISPEVIISEKNFIRLNTWLRQQGFIVEEVPYAEIAKQEGLLRCSTLPLNRSY